MAEHRVRFELQLGPLYLLFDPWPTEDAEDDEPSVQAVTSADASAERREDYGPPELHIGFRGSEE